MMILSVPSMAQRLDRSLVQRISTITETHGAVIPRPQVIFL